MRSNQSIIKITDILRGKHIILLYLEKETDVIFTLDKLTSTNLWIKILN